MESRTVPLFIVFTLVLITYILNLADSSAGSKDVKFMNISQKEIGNDQSVNNEGLDGNQGVFSDLQIIFCNAIYNPCKGTNDLDYMRGDNGNNVIIGMSGDDNITSNRGSDTIWGNLGNDVVAAGDGSDRVVGGDGDDTIYGEWNNDLIYGNEGNDHIYGDENDDILVGERYHFWGFWK